MRNYDFWPSTSLPSSRDSPERHNLRIPLRNGTHVRFVSSLGPLGHLLPDDVVVKCCQNWHDAAVDYGPVLMGVRAAEGSLVVIQGLSRALCSFLDSYFVVYDRGLTMRV